LLLSLIVLALVPLILSGTTAFLISTNTLYTVERDDLERAVDSVNRALADLQRGLRRTSLDYANWDDLHQGVADEKFDSEWLELNFGSGSTSLPNIHSLSIIAMDGTTSSYIILARRSVARHSGQSDNWQ
jgi:sensor domain CHASE-containing protein